jgi:hypothetical protein
LSVECVASFGENESNTEESRSRMNEGVELWAPGGDGEPNWRCRVSLTWTAKPLVEPTPLQALVLSTWAAKPLVDSTSLQAFVLSTWAAKSLMEATFLQVLVMST